MEGAEKDRADDRQDGTGRPESREEGPSPDELSCKEGPVLVATVGLPASGKTTWANEVLRDAPCFVRVNMDDLRSANPWRHEAAIRRMRDERIRSVLASGSSVIADNTNLRGLSDMRKLARDAGVPLRVKDFRDVPWHECVRRDAARAERGERATGRSVVIRMAMDAGLFELDGAANKRAVIIDLDGTLSDVSHRIGHLRGERKDWKAFFEGIPGDKVNQAVAALFHMAGVAGYTIIMVSGRPENYRKQSEAWLAEHGFDSYFTLFMRPVSDQRQDTEVKARIYDRYIAPFFDVIFTVDDRSPVVEMWRSKGLVCFQVAEGNY